jgi:hypothetical protein
MSAATRAEIRTKLAIKDYEAETGIPVAGNTKLEEIFGACTNYILSMLFWAK